MTNFVQLPSFLGVAENPVAILNRSDVRAALQRRRGAVVSDKSIAMKRDSPGTGPQEEGTRPTTAQKYSKVSTSLIQEKKRPSLKKEPDEKRIKVRITCPPSASTRQVWRAGMWFEGPSGMARIRAGPFALRGIRLIHGRKVVTARQCSAGMCSSGQKWLVGCSRDVFG